MRIDKRYSGSIEFSQPGLEVGGLVGNFSAPRNGRSMEQTRTKAAH